MKKVLCWGLLHANCGILVDSLYLLSFSFPWDHNSSTNGHHNNNGGRWVPSPYQSGHNQENKTAINSANREFHKIGDLSNGRVEKQTGDRWLEPRKWQQPGGPERGEERLLAFHSFSASQWPNPGTAWKYSLVGGGAGGQRPAGEG